MSTPPGRTPDVEVFPELGDGWPADGLGAVATIAAQLPAPRSLAPGALVVVRSSPRPERGALKRLLSRARPKAHRAVRCTALLALGYARVGGGRDEATGDDLAWGYAP